MGIDAQGFFPDFAGVFILLGLFEGEACEVEDGLAGGIGETVIAFFELAYEDLKIFARVVAAVDETWEMKVVDGADEADGGLIGGSLDGTIHGFETVLEVVQFGGTGESVATGQRVRASEVGEEKEVIGILPGRSLK